MRTLHQRMTEHKRVVRNSDPNNALAVHVSKSHHNIIWEEAKVVAREQHWTNYKRQSQQPEPRPRLPS